MGLGRGQILASLSKILYRNYIFFNLLRSQMQCWQGTHDKWQVTGDWWQFFSSVLLPFIVFFFFLSTLYSSIYMVSQSVRHIGHEVVLILTLSPSHTVLFSKSLTLTVYEPTLLITKSFLKLNFMIGRANFWHLLTGLNSDPTERWIRDKLKAEYNKYFSLCWFEFTCSLTEVLTMGYRIDVRLLHISCREMTSNIGSYN